MKLNIQQNQDGTYAMAPKRHAKRAEPVMLLIRCPRCGTKLRIRERMLNRKGKCPNCGLRLVVQPRSFLVRAVVSASKMRENLPH